MVYLSEMKHVATAPSEKHEKPDDFGARIRIYKDIADVTWRMFVPSIGGCVLGVLADRTFGTKPWFTVAGVTLGFFVVGFLIWQQLRKAKGEN